MELLHLCSMPTMGWAPSSIVSRDYKLVGDQWRRGAVDPSLLVVARKRMAAPMSFYRSLTTSSSSEENGHPNVLISEVWTYIFIFIFCWCLNLESKV